MDSLLASYASSDEEEEQEEGEQQPPPQQQKPQLPPVKPTTFPSSSLFSSLPKPQSSSSSSSLFQSVLEDSRTTPKPPSSVFSALPNPKSQKPTFNFTPSETRPKRVVQFKPPINPFSLKSIELGEDDGDDEEEENERRRKRDSASKSSLSGPTPWTDLVSAVPAPKSSASLGVLPSAGSGRRAIVETEVPVSNSADLRPDNDDSSATGQDNSATYQSAFEQNVVNYAEYYSYANYESGNDQNAVNYGYYESYNSGVDQSGNGSTDGGYGGYGDYGEYGQQYGNNWAEGSAATSAAAVLEVPGGGQSGFGVKRKRGRSEIPAEIVEVKQDELIKNRPREDQVKLTGIAFGPSYRPVSTKGKPTKLHKRKHQIGSLYYDMKQKEMELAERRSKGFLTKSETQAKYGW